ncbi:MAG: discoidin domain-containing protein, partial [Pseudomonadota bacterium]
MAVRWLISGGGNFSSTSVWNDGTLLGIPTTGDDVFTNGFTVNMDTNATVNSLNNSARARDIATPAMTANNAPSPYVAAASTVNSTNQPFLAFDRSNTTTSNFWEAGATTGWISMDFGSSIIIDAYTILGSSTQTRNPRNWTFEGSNNNSTWTVLQTVTLPSAIGNSSSYSSGSIGNITSYRYY